MDFGKTCILVGAIFGFLAVAFGAFGSHALKETLSDKSLTVYQTAVSYHFWHTLALIAVGLCARLYPAADFRLAGYAFIVGILLFSGSLYTLAITQIRPLGIITPFGGGSFLCGWAAFAWAIWHAV